MSQNNQHRLRRDGLTWAEVGDEVVVLDLHASRYFSGQGTAALLVSELVTGATTEQLVARVLDTYAISESIARTDVAAFIGELESHKLLEHFDA